MVDMETTTASLADAAVCRPSPGDDRSPCLDDWAPSVFELSLRFAVQRAAQGRGTAAREYVGQLFDTR